MFTETNVGGFLCDVIRSGVPATLFFSNGIGDFVLALPTLRALQSILPSSFTLLAGCETPRFLLNGLRFASIKFIEAPMRNGRRQVLEVGPATNRDEIFVSIVPWYNDSLESFLAVRRPALTIGHSPAFDVSVPLSSSVHATDTAFQFARLFEPRLRVSDFSYALQLPKRAKQFATDLRSYLPRGSFIVGMHLETAASKCVPAELATTLLRRLSTLPRVECVVVTRDRARLSDDTPRTEIRCELECAMAIISHADIFIGVDSCFLHVADLCNVPGVALFVDTSYLEFGYRFTASHLNITIANGENYDLAAKTIVQFVIHTLSNAGRA